MAWQSSLSIIQFALFPLFLVAAGVLRFRGLRLPRALVFLAFLGASVAFASTYTFVGKGHTNVIATALSEDPYLAESRIFRDKINSYLRFRSPERVGEYYGTPGSHAESVELMRKSHASAVVWGNAYWIHVSFQETSPVAVREFGAASSVGGLSELRMATSVPSIGLSYQPRNEAANFIAGIIAGMADRKSPILPVSVTELGEKELALIDAGNLVAFWTTPAHRALPWWFLGNLYTFEVLRRGEFDAGEISCAIRAYDQARSFLRTGDTFNAELHAAVFNNLGVLTAIQARRTEDPELMKRASAYLGLAAKGLKVPDIFALDTRAAGLARKNLRILQRLFSE